MAQKTMLGAVFLKHALCLLLLMRRVQDGLIAAGFHELRPAHTPVFQLLAPQGSRVTELAEQAGIAKQSMGYLINYLEEHGYVERVPDPMDGRAQLVRHTARGWEVNRISALLVWEIQQAWTQLLGEERMKHLLSLLSDLVSLLGEQYSGSVAELNHSRKHELEGTTRITVKTYRGGVIET